MQFIAERSILLLTKNTFLQAQTFSAVTLNSLIMHKDSILMVDQVSEKSIG
jgi:hypothetical protein